MCIYIYIYRERERYIYVYLSANFGAFAPGAPAARLAAVLSWSKDLRTYCCLVLYVCVVRYFKIKVICYMWIYINILLDKAK